ncbi:DNA/RNA nuclease SfsA [Salipaludibacillus daqingensis]|uniref:DNA/RNA nuclease SfsA n=1 Tax=Salipaludibacillus daqingensis TaxID=3041001 RepID=UPI00247333A1|nr:DNA/RNA nuclease SfsA [Salipaludibacillus daqingensis]
MTKVKINYSSLMVPSYFVERINRFMIKCKLKESGEKVEAHLPDSGRLKELLIEGQEVYLLPNDNPKRKTRFSAVCVQSADSRGWVSINSQVPNRIAQLAFSSNILLSYKGWEYVRAEYTKGHSRWDHLLKRDEEQMVVEVKGVTLVNDKKIGFFPDAVTSRGTKHVLELIEINKEKNWKASLLFVAQREDIEEIRPATDIDPVFSEALKSAAKSGVKIVGCRCKVSLDGIQLLDEIPIHI